MAPSKRPRGGGQGARSPKRQRTGRDLAEADNPQPATPESISQAGPSETPKSSFVVTTGNANDLEKVNVTTLIFPSINKVAATKESKCWDLKMLPHWSFRSLNTITGLKPLVWWDFGWKVRDYTVDTESTDRKSMLQKWIVANIPGQTLMMVIESITLTNGNLTSYLGFNSIRALVTWADTQCKSYSFVDSIVAVTL